MYKEKYIKYFVTILFALYSIYSLLKSAWIKTDSFYFIACSWSYCAQFISASHFNESKSFSLIKIE